jgi:Sulfotransferase family
MTETARGMVASDRPASLPAESRFTGPLFVVGMPRSGTKLLRDLLRGHPLIRIPPTESNLLPRWAAEWHRFGDLSDRQRFAAFYRRTVGAPYFLLMEKHTGGPIPEELWYSSCRGFGPAEVFEALIRHDVGAAPDTDLVWGDKSPTYTQHIALLGSLFPQARIIHIVRDVRDCCLSLRAAWGKNMIRGAQRWADGVMKARRDAELVAGRYLELRYEDLLADPERELRRCCEFLGLEYDSSLVELRYSTEHIGAARGAHAIVATNVRKFERMLDPRTRRRIEGVAAEALRAFGYDVNYAGRVRRVPPPLMAYYRLLDSVSFVRAQSRRSGFARTAQLQLAGRMRR